MNTQRRCLHALLFLLLIASVSEARPPNFVVIFTDDQGYGDLGCFGSQQVETPAIDRLAAEGVRLTSFYVAAPVCTPSRAGLMTGCYPKRVNLATGSGFGVLLAGDEKGLHPNETTIAEVLQSKGYATGIFGKWHLGDQPEFLPTRQGFDEFFGIPYSHDIHPFHPRQSHFQFPPLPLLDGERVLEMDPDADQLTKRITERAVAFIERHREQPFFLYVPHPIPHRPLHVSEPFEGYIPQGAKEKLKSEPKNTIDYRTRDQLFKAAIREIDWSVEQIIAAIRRAGVEGDTLVLFTSDNGPAVGSAGPLRGRKGSTFEGGVREATVAWWPGRIQANTNNAEMISAIDLLPTFAKLADAELPKVKLDGKDVSEVLLSGAKSPHDRLFYHGGNRLMAVRSGPWKYHWRMPRRANGKQRALYHLPTDIGEKTDVSMQHPEVVKRLESYLREFENELGPGDRLSDACRPAGKVANPKPLSK